MTTTESKTELLPTDREMLIALFNLVGALAERLTGERPTLRIPCGMNDYIRTMPSTWTVEWVKTGEGSSQSVDLPE